MTRLCSVVKSITVDRNQRNAINTYSICDAPSSAVEGFARFVRAPLPASRRSKMSKAKNIAYFPIRPGRFKTNESKRKFVKWSAQLHFSTVAESTGRMLPWFEEIQEETPLWLVKQTIQKWRAGQLFYLEGSICDLVEQTGLDYVEVNRIFEENSECRTLPTW